MGVIVIKDPKNESLENYVKINPFVDVDATYTWDGDNLATVVLTGLGYTKTITYSWNGTTLTSMSAVIT